MPHLRFDASGVLWLHEGPGGWHFLTLPEPVGAALRDLTTGTRSGWGSVRVTVTLGGTTWHTSVFPDARSGSYLLPVKKAVREAEGVGAADDVRVTLAVDL